MARALCPDKEGHCRILGSHGLGGRLQLGCTWGPCQASSPGREEAQKRLLKPRWPAGQESFMHVISFFEAVNALSEQLHRAVEKIK